MSVEEILQAISNLPTGERKQILQRIINANDGKEKTEINNIRQEIHESNPIESPQCISREWIKFGSYRGLQIRDNGKIVTKAICKDLRTLYTASDEQEAQRALKAFANKWDPKYAEIIKKWKANCGDPHLDR